MSVAVMPSEPLTQRIVRSILLTETKKTPGGKDGRFFSMVVQYLTRPVSEDDYCRLGRRMLTTSTDRQEL